MTKVAVLSDVHGNVTMVQGASFKPFIPLMITAAIYFILTFGISRVLGRFEKKLQQSDRKMI
ncbi:hypothetical protein H7R52_00520 [Weissella confusa]|uniref:Amino acid ABC transporter permease n=1 Tax=Weissella confusa TaxID=1583 RepID=A0A923NG09_WEICO|nr:hypothetical protein [Weissella confusa]